MQRRPRRGEQEQGLDWHIQYGRGLAKRHDVPVLWSVDLRRLWHRAPILAARLAEAISLRRHVEAVGTSVRVQDQDRVLLAAPASRQRRLEDFSAAREPEVQVVRR